MPDRHAATSSSRLRVALAIDTSDWHARQMQRALAALGVAAVPFRLMDAIFDSGARHGIRVPGFGESLPEAVLVRAVSAGTFEAVTVRLGALHALRALGVTVWNDARAIECCVDKSMTSFLLGRAGIPTPATWTIQSADAARLIVEREIPQGPLVSKPLFGSQGRGLRLIHTVADVPAGDNVAGVFYLQRFVAAAPGRFQDLRILVTGGRVVAAMARHADQWITNIKQGGRPVAAIADAEVAGLALRAASVVGADFAGVDIIRDSAGRPWVIEVNSMPAWRGLQKVTAANVAAVIASDLVGALDARSRRKAAM
ncbi:MAG: RimK family alpha-L-glutamate ligase [Methylobacteriaceae bacterium]|nr:RimK family alpha-L-glutamate ligase [Methylobacteriaceae bacterium]